MRMKLIFTLFASVLLSSCAIITVAGAATGAAIGIAGAAVGATVSVTGKVVGKTIDAVTPSKPDADK